MVPGSRFCGINSYPLSLRLGRGSPSPTLLMGKPRLKTFMQEGGGVALRETRGTPCCRVLPSADPCLRGIRVSRQDGFPRAHCGQIPGRGVHRVTRCYFLQLHKLNVGLISMHQGSQALPPPDTPTPAGPSNSSDLVPHVGETPPPCRGLGLCFWKPLLGL